MPSSKYATILSQNTIYVKKKLPPYSYKKFRISTKKYLNRHPSFSTHPKRSSSEHASLYYRSSLVQRPIQNGHPRHITPSLRSSSERDVSHSIPGIHKQKAVGFATLTNRCEAHNTTHSSFCTYQLFKPSPSFNAPSKTVILETWRKAPINKYATPFNDENFMFSPDYRNT